MRHRKIRIIITIAIVTLLVFAYEILISEQGHSSSRACGWGWGKKHKQVQTHFLKSEFKESLPSTLQINNFQCTGFQDLEVMANFEISHSDGFTLVSALERTYLEAQNNKYLPDNEKKRLQTTYPDKKRFMYTLPANGILHIRKLEVFIPEDVSKAVTVNFEGFQY